MIHSRDRMALRADKYWRSVWHVQMCMGFDVWPKYLTDAWQSTTVKAQPTGENKC